MGDKSSLPPELRHYWPMIEECYLPQEETGKIGYLTIHESQVPAGETPISWASHREPRSISDWRQMYEAHREVWQHALEEWHPCLASRGWHLHGAQQRRLLQALGC